MPKPHQTLRQLLQAARRPRAASLVHADYTRLRQVFILEQCTAHFELRADDPAPLFRKNLLDVGCGHGSIAEFLALSGAHITVVDANPEALARTQIRARAFGIETMKFLNAPLEALLPAPQLYDVIVASDLLETRPDPAKTLWILRQLLKPGGLLILSHITRGPRAWFYHVLLADWLYRRGQTTRTYASFLTPGQLTQHCEQAGLNLRKVQGLRFSWLKQRWKKSSAPNTRYLAAATLAG